MANTKQLNKSEAAFLSLALLLSLIFFWQLYHWLGLVIFLLSIILSSVLFFSRYNVSAPYLSNWLSQAYFVAKFKLSELNRYQDKQELSAMYSRLHPGKKRNEEKKRLNKETVKPPYFLSTRIVLAKFKIKLFYQLILLFKNAEDSFQTVREELQTKYGKLALVKDEDNKLVSLEDLRQRIISGRKVEEKLFETMLDEYFIIHRLQQKKVSRVTLATVAILIIATAANSLLLSFFFPNMYTRAASFGWLQTDWSGGADTNATANHTSDQTGWTKYFSKDANVDVTTTPGEAKLSAASDIWEQTTDADFNAGTLIDVGVSSNSVSLLKSAGYSCVTTNECICGSYCSGGVCSAPASFVTIGTQVWMDSNVNIGTMITDVTTQTNNATIEKYCYNNDPAICNTDGGLYQWDEMMQYTASCNGTGVPPDEACATPVQGICPSGTHIPSHYEWTLLERSVGSNPEAFPYDTTTTGWLGTNEGTNLKVGGSSGFGGILAGLRYTSGAFGLRGAYAFFWASTESGSNAWFRYLDSSFATVYRYTYDKAYGFSVRCLKD
jgi:uncharacterized protein (TIGR02145 family)